MLLLQRDPRGGAQARGLGAALGHDHRLCAPRCRALSLLALPSASAVHLRADRNPGARSGARWMSPQYTLMPTPGLALRQKDHTFPEQTEPPGAADH